MAGRTDPAGATQQTTMSKTGENSFLKSEEKVLRSFNRLVGALLVSIAMGACAFESINKDAMTLQTCRDRLAQPKNQRIKPMDPGLDLDGMCMNMLPLNDASKSGEPGKAAKP